MMKAGSARFVIQAVFLVWVLYLGIVHQLYGIERAAPIDGFCPFGGVAAFWTLVSTGEFIKRIYWASIVLMAVTAFMALSLGRVFCGHICPLGSLQEWLRGLGRKAGIKSDKEVPKALDKPLRNLKYVVLILVVYLTYSTGSLVFRDNDPYNALMHFGQEADEKVIGYSILAIVLVASLFYKNLWCRYLCPLGAFYAILSKPKRFTLRRDKDECISCGMCNRVCPHGIDVMGQEEVRDADCVSCLKCREVCPKSCITSKVFGKAVTQKSLSLFTAAVFVSLILASMALGFWQAASGTNLVDSHGAVDVGNIRGSNTLDNLVKTTNVPFEAFKDRLGLPEDIDMSLKLKDIGPTYGLENSGGETLEVEDFRKVVAEYLNLTYESSE